MAHHMEGNKRVYSPCQNPEAFTHKPVNKGKGAITAQFVHPHLHKEFWDATWAAIKAEPWYEADVSMVMVGSDGFAYCQYPGLTTGLARVFVGIR